MPTHFPICAPSKVEPFVPGWNAIHHYGLAGKCGHRHDRSYCGPLIKNICFWLGARGSPFPSTSTSPCCRRLASWNFLLDARAFAEDSGLPAPGGI